MIKSVFLGGGTPSIFPTKELNTFFDFLWNKNLIEKHAEITIEVNPGHIKKDIFEEYRKIGINRISIGAQSFQDKKLMALGRIHKSYDIYSTIEQLKEANFTNFNIDIMHGLPNQTRKDALYDLKEAISLNPLHLSWYQLSIEPNTAFAVSPPILPKEKELEKIEIIGKKYLKKNNFYQYEISAFSRSNVSQSSHNINYWHFGDYIGIGAGAHSKITSIKNKSITRYYNRKNPILYMQSKVPYGKEIVKKNQVSYEFMMNPLRLNKGFSIQLFENKTGIKIDNIQTEINKALSYGLLKHSNRNYHTTTLGKKFLNDLINLFNK